jgi:hypothetical protein
MLFGLIGKKRGELLSSLAVGRIALFQKSFEQLW